MFYKFKKKSNYNKGATLVEFALVVPIILLVFFSGLFIMFIYSAKESANRISDDLLQKMTIDPGFYYAISERLNHDVGGFCNFENPNSEPCPSTYSGDCNLLKDFCDTGSIIAGPFDGTNPHLERFKSVDVYRDEIRETLLSLFFKPVANEAGSFGLPATVEVTRQVDICCKGVTCPVSTYRIRNPEIIFPCPLTAGKPEDAFNLEPIRIKVHANYQVPFLKILNIPVEINSARYYEPPLRLASGIPLDCEGNSIEGDASLDPVCSCSHINNAVFNTANAQCEPCLGDSVNHESDGYDYNPDTACFHPNDETCRRIYGINDPNFGTNEEGKCTCDEALGLETVIGADGSVEECGCKVLEPGETIPINGSVDGHGITIIDVSPSGSAGLCTCQIEGDINLPGGVGNGNGTLDPEECQAINPNPDTGQDIVDVNGIPVVSAYPNGCLCVCTNRCPGGLIPIPEEGCRCRRGPCTNEIIASDGTTQCTQCDANLNPCNNGLPPDPLNGCLCNCPPPENFSCGFGAWDPANCGCRCSLNGQVVDFGLVCDDQGNGVVG